jgi:hypothetical protein
LAVPKQPDYNKNNMPNLTDLPNGVLGVICDFAYSPADVYNLHFTSQALFRNTKEKDVTEGGVHGESYFARKMQHALVQSMERALRQNRASTDRKVDIFKSFTALAKSLPPNSVAISGSIVVQAILGEQWDGSDIDVYCTNRAAPSVRTWLISELKQVLVGVCSRFTVNMSAEEWAHGLDFIDHVEHWANAPGENRVFQCIRGVNTWRFNSENCYHPSPMWSQGNRVYQDREDVYSSTPSNVIRTREDLVDVPYEPRLLDQCCKNDCQGTKKDIVTFDLIVVKQGSSIARAINDFDIVMCKSSWDGNRFNIPRPADTFGRRSGLSNCPEVRKIQAYVARIEKEAQRPFRSIMSELIDGRTPKRSKNIWQLRHEEASVHDFLRSTGVVPDTGAAKDLELVIDHFNVFSATLDGKLPRPILSAIKATRAILIDNSRGGGENSLTGEIADRRRFFTKIMGTHADTYAYWAILCDNPHPALFTCTRMVTFNYACASHKVERLFRKHNIMIRSLDRLQKYRNRGIEIKPNDYPPRELEHVLRKLDNEFISIHHTWEQGESTDDDSDDDYSYERSHGAGVNKRARVEEAQEARASAREEERWAEYYALVKAARTAQAESKHRAWVASIQALPPMGIVLPSDNEGEVKQKGCVQADQKAEG